MRFHIRWNAFASEEAAKLVIKLLTSLNVSSIQIWFGSSSASGEGSAHIFRVRDALFWKSNTDCNTKKFLRHEDYLSLVTLLVNYGE